MICAGPNKAEINYVCENMRESSREELFAVGDGNPKTYADWLVKSEGFKWVAYHNKTPCALIGAVPERGGVWALFGLGTDDWKQVWRKVTIIAKRDMMRAVLDAGAHRAHCMSLATHEETHKWLRFLGVSHEAEMPAYGNQGEDFILFSWLRDKENVLQAKS